MLFSLTRRAKNDNNFQSPIESIGQMLEKTWDLSKNFITEKDAAEAPSIDLFNRFFRRLNSIMTDILKNVVSLASLAPDMFRFAEGFKEKAQDQEKRIVEISRAGKAMAERVDMIASNTQTVSDDAAIIEREVGEAVRLSENSMERFSDIKRYVEQLVSAMSLLDENAKSISSITDGINMIADETNILSLNARIEAMRAGGTGSGGFKVIAEEISGLAKQSREATKDIRDRLGTLQKSVNDTIESVKMVEKNVLSGEALIVEANGSLSKLGTNFGHLANNLSAVKESAADQSRDVKRVSDEIADIEKTVMLQSRGVENILQAAGSINKICDNMVVSSGIFHLSGHDKARKTAESMAGDTALFSSGREEKERALQLYLKKSGFIELAYITDSTGRQVTSNIYSENVPGSDLLDRGYGNVWAAKEWFREPEKSGITFVSNVYRSSATGEFCFTVSVPLFDKGAFRGVLGIDINFKNMLNI